MSVNTTDKAQELAARRDRYVPKGHPNSSPFFVESATWFISRSKIGYYLAAGGEEPEAAAAPLPARSSALWSCDRSTNSPVFI